MSLSLIGSTSFGFAQNTIYDFELIVALSSTNATKSMLVEKKSVRKSKKSARMQPFLMFPKLH